MSNNRKNILLGSIAGIGLMAALGAMGRAGRRHKFQDKVVLITGGSRGLGLVLARQFAECGARIAICARDSHELQRAKVDLKERGAEAMTVVCDVRERDEVENLVDEVTSKFGTIDVLVNNAGVIQVGPLDAQSQYDFENAMRVHFWGPFYAMRAVLPVMRERGEGRILNISSIGGKIAVPHLAPYCASKFALAGLSSAMRAELAKENISITTVYPGLMRTGSHINALFKGQHRKEFAMFSIANGLPLTSVSAEYAARRIIDAAAKGKTEIVVSVQAKTAAKINALFPQFTGDLLALTNRLLPVDGGIGRGYASGLESRSSASPSLLTALVDAASYRNNELKPNETIN